MDYRGPQCSYQKNKKKKGPQGGGNCGLSTGQNLITCILKFNKHRSMAPLCLI